MLLALLLVAFSVIQTSPGAGAKDDDQKELERLEAEWNAAHVGGDATALDAYSPRTWQWSFPACGR
jgi:hypothetical protein